MNELSLTFDVPANIDPESQLMILIERAITNHKSFYGFEMQENVLIFNERLNAIQEAYYEPDEAKWFLYYDHSIIDCDDITHWMPLPEIEKGGQGE